MSCTTCSYKIPLAAIKQTGKSEAMLREERKCSQLICFVEQNKSLFASAIGEDFHFVHEFNRCRQLLDGDAEWRVKEKRC